MNSLLRRIRVRKSTITSRVSLLKKVARISSENTERNEVKAVIVQKLRLRFPLNLLLELVGLARSIFFYHLKSKSDKDAKLTARIQKIKADNPQYGYRRVAAVLSVNKKRVQRIIQQQGWQYQMQRYQCLLKSNGIQQSMSRKGNCLDNAAMESFFGRLKTECFYKQKFEKIEQVEQAI